MKNNCVEISVFGERNYRLFLDVIKQELDALRIIDINAVQAFILLNINESIVTVGDIITKGYYIGSNASYNIRKMNTSGYIQQIQSDYDRRAVFLKLTDNGFALCNKLDAVINKYASEFAPGTKGKIDLDQCALTLKKIEHFWKDLLARR
ncbi:MAG: winged helix DNA-binding protein [Holosporales bacterium]|jgi:DNA-binding MarR family transcriptional regulator|nr:winged helix DNA-binding protein [Holosporales bacterium]